MQGPAEIAREIFLSGLKRITGGALIRATLHRQGTRLVGKGLDIDLDKFERIWVCGAGKAAVSMAQGLVPLIGDKLAYGPLVTNTTPEQPTEFEILTAGHPVPNEASVEAGKRMLAFAQGLGTDDLLLFVLSGGTSALLEAPIKGISLPDLQTTNRVLLDSGWPIGQVNSVRKRLSRIKNGGLAQAFAPATTVCLVLSDVIGDDFATIGSGPLYPSSLLPLTELPTGLPEAVRVALALAPEIDEPPRVPHILVANARTAAGAFVAEAERGGCHVSISPLPFHSEAAELGAEWGRHVQTMAPRSIMVAFGESVVTLVGDHGKGGRAQEAALAAAIEIAGCAEVAVLVAGTDGIDGDTGAAGAVVDGNSVARAKTDTQECLDGHNAYRFHEAAGSLIKTGPTGTNLNEIAILVKS